VRLLYRVRIDYPEIVRIMLTGNSDQETAMQAVNEGNIFRFLTKPCDKTLLLKTLNDALVQYRVANDKAELLEKASYGHALAPWTADPTSAAYREVQEKVREVVPGEARIFQPSDGGIYIGKTIWVNAEYVVQSLSGTRVMVHPRNLVTNIPRVGEVVRIEYTYGQGVVIETKR
ncbi:MAG: hypothetical protein WBL63_00075, partial [Candidatus Acidiferrum sp.]